MKFCLRIKCDEVVVYCIMDRGYTGTWEHRGPLGRHWLVILFLVFTCVCGYGRCGFVRGDGRRQGYPLRDDTLFRLGVGQSEGQFQGQVTRVRGRGDREGQERENEREGGRRREGEGEQSSSQWRSPGVPSLATPLVLVRFLRSWGTHLSAVRPTYYS